MLHPLYHQKYHAIHRSLAKKGERCGDDEDPQDNTTEDTLDRRQLRMLMELLHAKDKADALRDRSSFTFMLSSVGRGDDSRLVYLSDMMTPWEIDCIGDNIHSP